MSNRVLSIFFLVFSVVLTVAVFAGIVITRPVDGTLFDFLNVGGTTSNVGKAQANSEDDNIINELTNRIVVGLDGLVSGETTEANSTPAKEDKTQEVKSTANKVEPVKSTESAAKQEAPAVAPAPPAPSVATVKSTAAKSTETPSASAPANVIKVTDTQAIEEERKAAIMEALKTEITAIIANEYATMKDSLVETIAPVVADNVYDKVEKDFAKDAEPIVEAYLNKDTVAPIIQDIIDENRNLIVMDTVDLVMEQLGIEKSGYTNQVVSAPASNSVNIISNESQYEGSRSSARNKAIEDVLSKVSE
ncbi:MAG: hypothetical protein K6G51_06850 [Sphaerochaetaceae bacterium]|nr:hypothetical protein [Sphaerochaetaceae bacterium]